MKRIKESFLAKFYSLSKLRSRNISYNTVPLINNFNFTVDGGDSAYERFGKSEL